MGDKRFSEVVEWGKHVTPYRVVQFIAGVGAGKNYWVENILMSEMRVLLVTSRKSKVEETKRRLGIESSLNIKHLEFEVHKRYLSGDTRFVSCVCNNWQIERYMKESFVKDDPQTHIWNHFDVIVIDENHSLATDATYADAPFFLYEFIKATYKYSNLKTILMTATFEPIDGMLWLENQDDYKRWDMREMCRNIQPKRIDLFEQEHILSLISKDVKIEHRKKNHVVYFATMTKTIANVIVPFLVENGVPEEKIAVSFSRDEDEGYFSDILLKNKERAEAYLSEHEDLPDDIKVFVTTSRNKEGINIKNDDCYWDVVIESHWIDEIRQMWGRVRSPINQVVIVTDAKQHSAKDCEKDFDYIFDISEEERINSNFDEWCEVNSYPLDNRYHNTKTKEKIGQLHSSRFPYLRYSPCDEKFVCYLGKVWGERSFKTSIDNMEEYFAYRRMEYCGMEPPEEPFGIKSLLFSPYTKAEKFDSYIKSKGFDNEKPLSKEEQEELLRYVSDVLRMRPKANPQNRYKNLNDALKALGYEAVECAKDKKKPLYGYRKLRRIKHVATDDEGDI